MSHDSQPHPKDPPENGPENGSANGTTAARTPVEPDRLHSDLDGLVGYNLKRAYMVVQADFRQVMTDNGLSARAFSILSMVVQTPGITQSALARRLGIERSGLVAIVDELEGAAYLQRVPVPGDRRVQALSPTAAGTAFYRAALQIVRSHEDAVLATLTTDERAQLIGLLKKIRARAGDAEIKKGEGL